MNDDELLDTLGAMEQAEIERRAPEWEDLAHGRRSAEDAADAVRARGDASEDEIARAEALFAPLSESFDDALVDRLAASRSGASAPRPVEAPEADDARVVERRDRAFWRRTGLGVGLAAAAAALVLVVVRSTTPPGADVPGLPELRALPAFELGVEAVRATVRSDHHPDQGPEAALEITAGEAVELLLRPASRHGETAKVWSCLHKDGARVELPTEIVDATAGATIVARTTIPADTARGSWTLVAVVATERPAEDPCALVDAPTHRVLRAPIVVAPRP
jgi:hypothetical protein